MYDYIDQGPRGKGMVRPNEQTAYGKVAGYPSVVLVVCGKLCFKSSDKPFVSASYLQNCSRSMMSSSLFCPVDTMTTLTPMISSIFRI